VPWAYDEEAVEVLRVFSRLKNRLMPYIYAQAVHTAQSGTPMMRSMVMEFPGDRACEYLDKQYMLGDSLLVAPIFNENGIGEYYLPAGTWTCFLTSTVNKGGGYHKDKYDYLSLPLLAKENSIIVTGSRDDRPDYAYAEDPTINIFTLIEGGKAKAVVYEKEDGEVVRKLKVQANKKDGKITIKVTADGSYSVRLVNFVAKSASVEYKGDGKDTVIKASGEGEMTLE
jgi:alpha-D-xyloside xylohydrolase